MHGVKWKIPNAYGSYLNDVIFLFQGKQVNWRNGPGEILANDGFQNILTNDVYTSEGLMRELNQNDYYVIFADLKAFHNESPDCKISTYEKLESSGCQFALRVIDQTDCLAAVKDAKKFQELYRLVVSLNYENVEILDVEELSKTTFAVWD